MKRKDFLQEMEVGEPFFVRNLLLYPFYGNGGKDYTVLEEALKEGIAVIEDTGRIEEVNLTYKGEIPLFLVDGEEIIGAFQNRVVNTAVLVGQVSHIPIPVTCVEEGRWSGERVFRSSLSSAYPSLRALLASSVTDSLRMEGTYRSNQSGVWRSISKKLTSLSVSSLTSSMHDIYKKFESDLSEYTHSIEKVSNIRGFVAVAGEGILGMDLFGSSSLFKKLGKKLLAGYALEAIEKTSETTPFLRERKVKNFINEVEKCEVRPFKAVCLGKEFRGKTSRLVVRYLINDGELIHLSAFPLS